MMIVARKSAHLWYQVIVTKFAKTVNQYVQRVKKYVNGKLNHRTFEDQDGKKQYVTEVIADEVLLKKCLFTIQRANIGCPFNYFIISIYKLMPRVLVSFTCTLFIFFLVNHCRKNLEYVLQFLMSLVQK